MKFVKVNDFEMQTTTVIQAQWEKVMGNNPSYFRDKPDNPVETVSWDDCQEFIEKLNQNQKEYTYRLPTEEEWELCAKSFDDQKIETIAWCHENSGNRTHKVRIKKPNKLGLYDMLGNVWEWTDTIQGSGRVFRGGSWGSSASNLRSADRGSGGPGDRYVNVGFRLLRTPYTFLF